MKERGILFSAPMVRAIMDGNKNMTRRVAKLNYSGSIPGDRLWVRETFQVVPPNTIFYKADKQNTATKGWIPSIFMPRWASRITLEITNIRVERLQEITEEDARAEGCGFSGPGSSTPRWNFQQVWGSINGKKHPWESNPFIWVISFKRMASEVEELLENYDEGEEGHEEDKGADSL